MSAHVIDRRTSLEAILDGNAYTLGKLQSHPLTAPFAAGFETFQAAWTKTNTSRLALRLAAGKAYGAAVGADDELDDIADAVDRALLAATGNDRNAALYGQYFGAQTVLELKRPILNAQLATMRAWVPLLKASKNAALTKLGAALETKIAAADVAVAAHEKAAKALNDFDTVGPRKALLDKYNALRKTTCGELAKLPAAHPAAMLPSTFAERFFRHPPQKGMAALKSATDVKEKIDDLQQDVADHQGHLATLEAAADAKRGKREGPAAGGKAKAGSAKSKAPLKKAAAAKGKKPSK